MAFILVFSILVYDKILLELYIETLGTKVNTTKHCFTSVRLYLKSKLREKFGDVILGSYNTLPLTPNSSSEAPPECFGPARNLSRDVP